jgi:hypothetical protein
MNLPSQREGTTPRLRRAGLLCRGQSARGSWRASRWPRPFSAGFLPHEAWAWCIVAGKDGAGSVGAMVLALVGGKAADGCMATVLARASADLSGPITQLSPTYHAPITHLSFAVA